MHPSPSLRTHRARRPPRASVCGATATAARGRRRMGAVAVVVSNVIDSRVDGMSNRSIPNIDRARRTHRSNARCGQRRGPPQCATRTMGQSDVFFGERESGRDVRQTNGTVVMRARERARAGERWMARGMVMIDGWISGGDLSLFAWFSCDG